MDRPALDVLLISPDGMLGRAWLELLEARAIAHRTAQYPELDLTDPDSLVKTVPSGVTHVVNCAAYTDVDGAEADETTATAVNGTGVGHLAARCHAIGAQLVHYSTDYVFAGDATTPYPTDGPRAPLNAYGRSKAVGEEAIEASGVRHLVIRTSWLYAPWGQNFVLTMRRLTGERDTLKVVDDQRGRPTSCLYLAARSLGLIEQNADGLHHVTDGGECTWYEFTREISRQLNHDCEIAPCTTAEFPRPARRPAYSTLDLSRTEALLGPSTPWQDNLRTVLARVSSVPKTS